MDLEKDLEAERISADKELEELEELLEETEPPKEKVPLIDREWKEISIDELDAEVAAAEELPAPKNVNEKWTRSMLIYQAEFEDDTRAAVRRSDGTHNTVLVKCECSDASNCQHILGLWSEVQEKVKNFGALKDLAKEKKEERKEEKEVKKVKKKEERKVEARAEAKADKIAKFASEIRSKLVVIYGQPYAGKTTLTHALSQHFERTVYFKVDRNFSREDFEHIAKNVYYIEIGSPQQLLKELHSLARSPPQGALIAVDSVTSLDSFFVPSDPTTPSPRMENARAKFADAVMQLLSFVKGLNTVVVIAHEKIKDFKTEEIVPRFNIVALRHADSLYHITVENNKRKVKKVQERKRIEKPDFDFS